MFVPPSPDAVDHYRCGEASWGGVEGRDIEGDNCPTQTVYELDKLSWSSSRFLQALAQQDGAALLGDVGLRLPRQMCSVGYVGTLQTGYPYAQDLKDQPHGSILVPGARELWLRHVPRGTEHATCQERAPVSSCALRHIARHPPGKGSGVATCPDAPSASPTRKVLWCCHVPRGIEPITQQERTPESPCASRLQARPLRRKALTSPRDRDTRTTVR
jgi:hypothetical protein